jgi:hypothetical protein
LVSEVNDGLLKRLGFVALAHHGKRIASIPC